MNGLRQKIFCMRGTTWLILLLLCGVSIGVIIACGKLSNDSQQPTTPTGTTGGVPLQIGPQRCWGTYCLTVEASPSSFPADGVTYTGLKARLTDTSGRSLENFLVTFNTSTTSDGIGYFRPFTAGIAGAPSPALTGLTHSGGTVSVRMYGAQSGSVVVQAKVDIDQNAVNDLFTTTVVILTPSSGDTSSAGSYRLSLTADPMTITGNGIDFSRLTAQVTDSSGGSVSGLKMTFTLLTGTGTLTPTTVDTDEDGVAYSQLMVTPPSGGSILIMAQATIPDLDNKLLTKMIRISVISVPFTPTPQPTAMPTATAQPTVTPTAAPTPIPVSITFDLNPAPTNLDQWTFIMDVRANNLPLSGIVMNLATSPSSAAFPDGSAVQRTTNSQGQISDTITFTGNGDVILNVMVDPGQGYSGTGLLTIIFLP